MTKANDEKLKKMYTDPQFPSTILHLTKKTSLMINSYLQISINRKIMNSKLQHTTLLKIIYLIKQQEE